MSSGSQINPSDILKGLDEEAKVELLEHLAEELGFDLSEPVDPQSDVVDVLENSISSLEAELRSLRAQFGDNSELDYAELTRAGEVIATVAAELSEAHANLNTFIDSEFDVEDEDEDEEG